MKIVLRCATRGLLVTAAALLAFAAPASAEDLPFVDGHMWVKTAKPLKRAYLIGIGNLINAEYAYQKEMGPPSDRSTSIQRAYEGIDDMTLDECVARIDAWYERNADKRDTTVLEVIWLDMVEPNLPASRRYD